jgi:YegS/Rv2252/BmrU family lipid kinase
MDKKIYAIINPTSNSGKTKKIWSASLQKLKNSFPDLSYRLSGYSGQAMEIAAAAVKSGYNYILAVGGDGTINEVANGILKVKSDLVLHPVKLIIFPQGTGSDLSRSLELKSGLNYLIERIKKNKVQAIKTVKAQFKTASRVETRYFVNIADCGMGAAVAKQLNQNSDFLKGRFAYLIAILQILFKYKNKLVTIKADGEIVYQGKLNTAVVASGKYFGGGIKIAPQANLSRADLNLVLLKNISSWQAIFNLIRAYRGSHLQHELVSSCFANNIEISSQIPLTVELDGEIVGCTKANFKLSSRKLLILVD